MKLTKAEMEEFIQIIVNKTKVYELTETVLVEGSNISDKDNGRLYELMKKGKCEKTAKPNLIVDDYNPDKVKE